MKQAIIFGGKSFEHEISIVSAITVAQKIPTIEIFIFLDDRHGFYLVPKGAMKASTFSSGSYKKFPKLRPIERGFETLGLWSKKLHDLEIINMIHGGDGEDGIMASLFTFYNISFIGPKTAASVISCDKFLTKLYAQGLGVKVVDYLLVRQNESFELPFEFPVIVKPLNLGSSIGVSVVKEAAGLSYALDTAFEYDSQALIEPFIDGVAEYNLAGTFCDGTWHLSMIEAPKKESFLDFDTKYLDFSRTTGAKKADILDKITDEIQMIFKRIYGTYFIGSIIRCDFFVIDEAVYLNEINPIPGSLANYLFEDIASIVTHAFHTLPQPRDIRVNYRYIDKIHASKGK